MPLKIYFVDGVFHKNAPYYVHKLEELDDSNIGWSNYSPEFDSSDVLRDTEESIT